MVAINLPQLPKIQIASPCSQDWGAMTGTDQVRHCGECKLNVYNLSDMTTQEAMALIERTEGNLCVRMYQRPDGTVITQDCPVGLAAARAHVARMVCRAAALAASVFAAVVLGHTQSSFESRGHLTESDPFYSIASALGRAPQNRNVLVMGKMCSPRTPPPPTTPTTTSWVSNFWSIFQ